MTNESLSHPSGSFVTRHSSFVTRHCPNYFPKDVPEIVQALLADDPTSREEGSFRKPLPAASAVLEQDGVRLAVKTNDMVAGDKARARACDARIPIPQVRLHQFQKRQRCSGRR